MANWGLLPKVRGRKGVVDSRWALGLLSMRSYPPRILSLLLKRQIWILPHNRMLKHCTRRTWNRDAAGASRI
jgi:hypothetical protein